MGFKEKVLVIRLEYIDNKMTTEAVYKYMKLQNRPHSVNDVSGVLEKEKHGKVAIQQALDKLTDQGKLFVKTYEKQKVYCLAQESKQSLEEIKNIERELQVHSNEQLKKLEELEKEVKSQESILNSLKCSMSLEDAIKERDQLKEVTEQLLKKLDELMEASGTEDLNELKKKADSNYNLYNREYIKRKRICNDVLDCILENYPGSKKQLYDEIGINIV